MPRSDRWRSLFGRLVIRDPCPCSSGRSRRHCGRPARTPASLLPTVICSCSCWRTRIARIRGRRQRGSRAVAPSTRFSVRSSGLRITASRRMWEIVTLCAKSFWADRPTSKPNSAALFAEGQKLWQVWWSKHWQEFVTREELQSVELPVRQHDVIEMAGLARYGPLFPTGPHVRLGPVRLLRLTESAYFNGRSHLDFDTGRVFTHYEGVKVADWGPPTAWGPRVQAWRMQNGIDVRCQGGLEASTCGSGRLTRVDGRLRDGHPERLAASARTGSEPLTGTFGATASQRYGRRAPDVSVHDARRGTRDRSDFRQGSRFRSVSPAIPNVVDSRRQAGCAAAG